MLPQVLVAQKVAAGVYRGVTTTELDDLAAETAAAMTSTHPDYALVRASLLALPLLHAAPWLTSICGLPCSWPRASLCPTCTRTRSSPSPRREYGHPSGAPAVLQHVVEACA